MLLLSQSFDCRINCCYNYSAEQRKKLQDCARTIFYCMKNTIYPQIVAVIPYPLIKISCKCELLLGCFGFLSRRVFLGSLLFIDPCKVIFVARFMDVLNVIIDTVLMQ